MFDGYDLNAILNTWLISISRIKLLQEKNNSENKLITYRFEKLVEHPSDSMKILSNKLNVNFEDVLKNIGINSEPNHYYKNVLREDEIKHIKNKINEIDKIINDQESFEINLKDVNDKYFFDIKNHRKASTNINTWSMYCALGYSGFRKLKLSKSNYVSAIAYFFSIFVMVWHIPRLLKQKFFPGLGKQNYT